MNIAFFISDEGYGHAMRQKNVIRELLEHCPYISITVYTKDKISVLQDAFGERIKYVNIFNYILLSKDSHGVLDSIKTHELFEVWHNSLDTWLAIVKRNFDPNTQLIVSDSVPQVTLLHSYFQIKTIFIQHFTWDWLYSSLYSEDFIFDSLFNFYAHSSSYFLFPPLTPQANLALHPVHHQLDFIVNKQLILASSQRTNSFVSDSPFRLLLMNNGTRSITAIIKNILLHLPAFDNWRLFLRNDTLTSDIRALALSRPDVILIDGLNSVHLELSNASLVLARPGYNIISETLALRKEVVFLQEPSNPEINSNLDLIKEISYFHTCSRDNCLTFLQSLMKKFTDEQFSYSTTALGSSQAMLHIVESIAND